MRKLVFLYTMQKIPKTDQKKFKVYQTRPIFENQQKKLNLTKNSNNSEIVKKPPKILIPTKK